MEQQQPAHQEAEPLKRHSFVPQEAPAFDRPSQPNLVGNMAAQRGAKGAAAAAQPAAKTGASGAGNPAVPRVLHEASCVTENLDEENRLSYTSPGRVAARTSPPPPAISFFNYGNDQATPKPEHVRYLSALSPQLTRNRVAVKVIGRASCPGDAAHNLELSQSRAEIVADLLKPAVRVMDVHGVGESQPVADNATVEGRSRNRSVDIIPLRPPVPPPSLCKVLPALCQVPPPPPPPGFCQKHPELCQIPNFCQLFPNLCQDCTGDGCGEDHHLFCVLFPGICTLLPFCILAPEVCFACIVDPALCVGILECIVNPAACMPPPPPGPITPVTVQFTRVRAANTPVHANDRIPDEGATGVAVIVTGWRPPMPPIRIYADGGGGVNGDVLIDGANQIFLTGSTIVQVEGIEQTSPSASRLPLALQATMGPALVGHSLPFAVADLMENIDIALESVITPEASLLDPLQSLLTGANVIHEESFAGMVAAMRWDSDGADGTASLDQVRFDGAFHVRAASGRWNPFTDTIVSVPGNKHLHFEVKEQLPLTGPARRRTELLLVQRDSRSQSTAAITKSGYEIDEVVEPDPLRSGCMRLVLTQTGSAVSVQGFRSDAGSGMAAATIPLDCEFECGSPQLPDTQAHWTGSDRGESMTANPLTKCGPHGSDHNNSAMTLPGWRCVRAAQENSLWVHAHLLHGKTGSPDLHGPGNAPENLIITDKSINGLMYNRVEQLAIRRTLRNETLSYQVDSLPLANNGDRRYFADGMNISLNRIDPITRQITETIFSGIIRSGTNRQPPSICT